MKLPIYECTNQYNEFSEQLYPVNISNVKWVNLICDKYPNGCIQISCHDAQENAYYATRLLKCYVSKKGRYAIWGKHRFYEGYSGALILRGVPYKTVDTIKDAAKPYGTIVEWNDDLLGLESEVNFMDYKLLAQKKKLNMLTYDIGSNIGFIADQFNEQMDKTVMEAKGEIESFCQNKINAIANASLVEHREEFLKLENPVDIESE